MRATLHFDCADEADREQLNHAVNDTAQKALRVLHDLSEELRRAAKYDTFNDKPCEDSISIDELRRWLCDTMTEQGIEL